MYNGSVYIGNRGGLPIVQATPTVGTADVQIGLPNHVFRFLGAKGKIILQMTTPVPTGTTGTLPVLAQVNGQTLAINTTVSGIAITAADITNVTTLELLFDKVANTLTVTSTII